MKLLLPILLLTAIYALLIAALIYLLRRWQAISKHAVLLGFLIFGAAAGVLASWVWPYDSAVYLNLYGVLLGDWMYQLATAAVSGPGASQPHEAIPLLLRVPVVYVLSSGLLYGIAGWLLELMLSRRRNEPSAADRRQHRAD